MAARAVSHDIEPPIRGVSREPVGSRREQFVAFLREEHHVFGDAEIGRSRCGVHLRTVVPEGDVSGECLADIFVLWSEYLLQAEDVGPLVFHHLDADLFADAPSHAFLFVGVERYADVATYDAVCCGLCRRCRPADAECGYQDQFLHNSE